MSKIEWTEQTWNPLAGCTKVSKGCDNCYAITMAHRLSGIGHSRAKYAGTTKRTENGSITWSGKITLDEKALLAPLSRTKPTLYFVNSMSDLFHKDVPFEYIDKVFAIMALTPQHTYQVLTKRPERMAEWFSGQLSRVCTELDMLGDEHDHLFERTCEASLSIIQGNWPLPNVWLGTSVEDQKAANERIPHLMRCPAAVRFLSCEPLLGPLNLKPINEHSNTETWPLRQEGTNEMYSTSEGVGACGTTGRLHWVIAGGESGHNARPVHPDWLRKLRDQCAEANVPFFFKQWGEFAPVDNLPFHTGETTSIAEDGGLWNADWGFEVWTGRNFESLFKVGKAAAGCLLDGVEHKAMPQVFLNIQQPA